MLVNYKPGKTEVLIAVHGGGSRDTRAALMGRQDAISFPVEGGGEQQLHICYEYTHLGTRITSGGGSCRDLNVKAAKAKHPVFPLRRHVLRNEAIPPLVRARLVEALGLSIASFNVGLWPGHTWGTMRQWIVDVTSLYRCLLANDRTTGHPDFPTAETVSGAVGLPFPASLLIRERLLHWLRLIEQNREDLWELLMHEFSVSPTSWLGCVQADLDFLRYWQPKACEDECWQRVLASPLDAMAWASDNPGLVRRAIRRAIRAQTQSLSQWAAYQLVRRKGGAHLPQVAEDAGGLQPALVCEVCGEHFASRNALAGHHAKQHGSAKLARRLCSGCTCPVCVINYGDHDRLVRHLSFSGTPCLAFLAASRPQQEPAPGVRTISLHGPPFHPVDPNPCHQQAELFHVAAESSCFDVQALRRSVASFDPALADALGAFDDSLNICASLPAELPINSDGLVLMQRWARSS